jgi:hypothetical protein
MTLNISRQITALRRMMPKELRIRYAEVFGEPTRSGNKEFLIKRIAWRLQSQAEGGLSDRARCRAEQLARDADIRLTPPKATASNGRTVTGTMPSAVDDRFPPPGTVITRDYKGQTLRVTVLQNGFEYEGEVYRSISAVATAITGSHLSGIAFFNLGRRK